MDFKIKMNNKKTLYVNATDLYTDMCKIGGEYNTDKSPYALNSICLQHRKGYTPIYSILFAPYFNKRIKLAEIGIEEGSSLKLWRKFFKSAYIYAFEIDDNKIQKCVDMSLSNIRYYKIDVSDIVSFNEAFKKTSTLFDIIIDDSSHAVQHQNNVINNAHRYLKNGGILVIEDIPRDITIDNFEIDTDVWEFYTFIICDHINNYCLNNDKILYLVKK